MDGFLVKITPDRCAHLVSCSEVPITFTHHARLLGEDFGWIDHHRGDGLSVLADTAADEPRNISKQSLLPQLKETMLKDTVNSHAKLSLRRPRLRKVAYHPAAKEGRDLFQYPVRTKW